MKKLFFVTFVLFLSIVSIVTAAEPLIVSKEDKGVVLKDASSFAYLPSAQMVKSLELDAELKADKSQADLLIELQDRQETLLELPTREGKVSTLATKDAVNLLAYICEIAGRSLIKGKHGPVINVALRS